ncbi:MAG: hypothetical protein ACLT5Y_12220 [Thomasclavelia ramosa]
MQKVFIVIGNQNQLYQIEIDCSVKIGSIKYNEKFHNSVYEFAKSKLTNWKSNNPIEIIINSKTYCFPKNNFICIKKIDE